MVAHPSRLPSRHCSSELLAQRAAVLQAHFVQVQHTRMQGIPLLHPKLAVEVIGCEPASEAHAEGVLLTPWFMSLLRLPLLAPNQDVTASPHWEPALQVGHHTPRWFGGECFDFIAAFDPAVGWWETCALFSVMQEAFTDQAHARATAHAVLAQLRADTPNRPPTQPDRRRWLFRTPPAAA